MSTDLARCAIMADGALDTPESQGVEHAPGGRWTFGRDEESAAPLPECECLMPDGFHASYECEHWAAWYPGHWNLCTPDAEYAHPGWFLSG